MVARTKWRQHCSTCGKQFPPQTWAYCSKACESARTGFAAAESREEKLSDWLSPLYERRMNLRQQLETAMPWERVRLLQEIAETEAKEAAVRECVEKQPRAAEPRSDQPALRRDQVEFWATILQAQSDRFVVAVQKSLQVAILLGTRLLEAKEALPHGEFGRLFAEHEKPVEGALTISSRWARKLMTLAANGAISNRKHASVLPGDVETVYLLSRLPEPELEAAIAAGSVTRDMRRGDARDLLPADDDSEPVEPVDEIAKALEPVGRALRRFAAEHASEFGDLKARLKTLLRAIEVEIAGSALSAGIELSVSADRADMPGMDHLNRVRPNGEG